MILVVRLLSFVLCLYFCVLILVIISFLEDLHRVALEWNLEMMILKLTSLSKSCGTHICFFMHSIPV
jgi:hypothetical protein